MEIPCVRAQILHWVNIKIYRVLDFDQKIVSLQENDCNISQVLCDRIQIDLIISSFKIDLNTYCSVNNQHELQEIYHCINSNIVGRKASKFVR